MLLGTTSSASSVSTSVLVDLSYSSFGRFGLVASSPSVAARQMSVHPDSTVSVSPWRRVVAGLTSLGLFLHPFVRGETAHSSRPAA